MEPENRPYIDPDTKPGDAGTEDWADKPIGTTESDIVEGSPADEFVNDPDAIEAHKDEGDRA